INGAKDLILGNGAGGSGTYTILAGTLTANNNVVVGSSGTGSMTIQKASVYVANALNIAASSTVTLNSGTLRFNSISGVNRLVYTGGTIQLTGARVIGSDSTIATLYGASPVIPAGKGLILETADTHNVNNTFQVNGGSFTNAGDLIVGGSTAGNLQLSNNA